MQNISHKNPNGVITSIKRTEEVQHIIDRIPTKFASVVSGIVLFIVFLLILFGWLIRYPDVLSGQITINSKQAPLKLVASQSGRLRLSKFNSGDKVNAGEILGWLENPTDINHVLLLQDILEKMAQEKVDASSWYQRLPKNIELGEINPKYFGLLNSLKLIVDFNSNLIFDKQIQSTEKLLEQQRKGLHINLERKIISQENLNIINRSNFRDSTLFANKVLSEGDFDRSKINNVSAKEKHLMILKEIENSKEQISKTESQIQDLSIKKIEKIQQLNLDLTNSFNDLRDNLTLHQQHYFFKAPFDGFVQFLNFWSDGQFVQGGEAIFTVLPAKLEMDGQVILPDLGAGKVKINQEVIVKLNNYPYIEYGSVTGYVKKISLSANTTKNQNESTDVYMILVEFPDNLKTNYNKKLAFTSDIKGTAEIITNDRRLVHRLFDNMKYILNK